MNNPQNINTLEKIYRVFDSIEPDEYGCKNWPGATNDKGYGRVTIENRIVRPHRLALERKLGRPIKLGYFACHTCDWPSCINPEHLYEGTHKTNAQDRTLRHPETWDYMRNEDPNSSRRLKAKEWQESTEGREHWKKIQPTGIIARWKKDLNTKK